MEQWKRTVFPLILLFSAIMFDGVIAAVLREHLITDWGLMIPRLTMLVLIVLAFYLKPSHLVTLAVIFGFLYDSYYTGYLGIYMAAFALISWFVLQLRTVFHTNILIYILLSVIMITVLEFFGYGVYRAIGITSISPQEFLAQRLGATLLLNSVLMLILSYPLDKFVQFIVQTEDRKYRQGF